MNKNTSRLYKLAFLIVAFVFYFIFKNGLSDFLFPKKINQPFKNLTVDLITQVELVFDNKTVNIYKKNNQWTTGEFKADSERLSHLIENTSKIIKDEFVSTNKKRHIDFGIQNNKITFITKDKKYSLYIGSNSGIDKNYVKINDENEVFQAPGFIDIFTPFDYRDLNVGLITDENKITSLSINDLVLERKKDKWFINEKEAKKDRVDFFLSDLKTLKATDISTSEANLLFPELTIKLKDNKEITAQFFPENDEQQNYFLKISNSNLIFQIPTVYVNSLKKEEKDFIE